MGIEDTKRYRFRVELEEEDGEWVAVVPLLPGCALNEPSRDVALAEIREDAQMYVEVLIEDGRPVPQDDDGITEDSIVIEVWA